MTKYQKDYKDIKHKDATKGFVIIALAFLATVVVIDILFMRYW